MDNANPLKILGTFLCVALILLFATNGLCVDTEKESYFVEDLSFEELNKLELLANEARSYYWKGEYSKALDVFNQTDNIKHPSTPLYYSEMTSCYLAIGKVDEARKHLTEASRFFQTYNTAEIEKRAMPSFGKESEKIYMGDPYERAANYLLLALIYMNNGDYDNALAACKSGLLADSDTKENKFESDFTFLHLLEAKLHQLRGDDDYSQHCLKLAKESYLNTSTSVRDAFSEYQEWVDIQQLPKKERKKLGIKKSDEEISQKLQSLKEKISQKKSQVDAEKSLDVLFLGDYNTLIVVPEGRGPQKYRKGLDANYIFFDVNSSEYLPTEIIIDGNPLHNHPIKDTADINYQATTRGGRRMDALLEGQAVYRKSSVLAGKVIVEVGGAVPGILGLAVTLAGAAVQSIGGAINPEADTRSWQLLPAGFSIYALKLPEGEHEIIFRQRVYFEKRNERREKIILEGSKDIAVLFAPPPLTDAFMQLNNGMAPKRRKRNTAKISDSSVPILVTPTLGLKRILKFPKISEKKKPKAFSPDPRKIGRKTEKKFTALKISAKTVDHSEIILNINKLISEFPFALQTELVGLHLTSRDRDEHYSAEFKFTLVDTRTGLSKVSRNFTGEYLKARKDKISTTQVFYKCFDNALGKFISETEFTATIQNST